MIIKINRLRMPDEFSTEVNKIYDALQEWRYNTDSLFDIYGEHPAGIRESYIVKALTHNGTQVNRATGFPVYVLEHCCGFIWLAGHIYNRTTIKCLDGSYVYVKYSQLSDIIERSMCRDIYGFLCKNPEESLYDWDHRLVRAVQIISRLIQHYLDEYYN